MPLFQNLMLFLLEIFNTLTWPEKFIILIVWIHHYSSICFHNLKFFFSVYLWIMQVMQTCFTERNTLLKQFKICYLFPKSSKKKKKFKKKAILLPDFFFFFFSPFGISTVNSPFLVKDNQIYVSYLSWGKNVFCWSNFS